MMKKKFENQPEKLIFLASPLQTKLTVVKHAFDFAEFVVHLKKILSASMVQNIGSKYIAFK